MRYPPRIPAGTRVAQPVSTLGVFATILDLAGIEPPPTLQVASLAPLATGAAHEGGGPILSELHVFRELAGDSARPDPQMQPDRRYRLLREGKLKLVTSSKGDQFLYDLAPIRARRTTSRPSDPQRSPAMRARLAQVQQEIGLPALDAPLDAGEKPPELDAATRERLRALGYTQ